MTQSRGVCKLETLDVAPNLSRRTRATLEMPAPRAQVLCEDAEDAVHFDEASGWLCPVEDVYDEQAMTKSGLVPWTWQAYTVSEEEQD